MRIISIDPGYERLGLAVLEKENGIDVLVYSDCLRTYKNLPYPDRLLALGNDLSSIIEKFSPKALASESLFFTKNQKTAIDVAGVRGMILFIAKKYSLSVFEYTPLQIKIAVTGYGRSDKKQVTEMVAKLIDIKKEINIDDEYDAIAVGLTCLASERF